MRHALLAAAVSLASVPAAAAPAAPPAGGRLAVTTALGGGAELGSGGTTGLAELEVGAGWELAREVRPELSAALALAPSTTLALRPGLRFSLPGGPFHVRTAVDWSHESGDWRVRWLLVGAVAELRVTSVLGAFVEVDAGVPLARGSGVGALARAGFAFHP